MSTEPKLTEVLVVLKGRHIPAPLQILDSDDEGIYLHTPGLDYWLIKVMITPKGRAKAEATADYVLRAVNSHEALMSACEAALDDDPCRSDHHGACQTHRLGNPCEQQLIRIALAKARGES